MIKLSFIIPLYNCREWIGKCLDEIFKVRLSEDFFEVIVIDDGSRDDGADIVEQYKEKHGNIVMIKQENSGASAARNRGLDVAHGEWIWFVDADDAIQPEVLNAGSLLRREMDCDAEMIVFNYLKVFSDHVDRIEDIHEVKNVDGCEALQHGNLYLWNRLFRKSTLKDVRFVEGTKNIEDFYFDICAILPLRRVVFIPVIGYSYNQQNMSSTSRNATKENLKKLSDDTQTIYMHLLNDIVHLEGRQRDVAAGLLNESIVGYLYSLFTRYDGKSLRDGIDFLRSNGLYPAKRTGNRKANVFRLVANREWLLLLMQRIIHGRF